jgi:hypothetical protein
LKNFLRATRKMKKFCGFLPAAFRRQAAGWGGAPAARHFSFSRIFGKNLEIFQCLL